MEVNPKSGWTAMTQNLQTWPNKVQLEALQIQAWGAWARLRRVLQLSAQLPVELTSNKPTCRVCMQSDKECLDPYNCKIEHVLRWVPSFKCTKVDRQPLCMQVKSVYRGAATGSQMSCWQNCDSSLAVTSFAPNNLQWHAQCVIYKCA